MDVHIKQNYIAKWEANERSGEKTMTYEEDTFCRQNSKEELSCAAIVPCTCTMLVPRVKAEGSSCTIERERDSSEIQNRLWRHYNCCWPGLWLDGGRLTTRMAIFWHVWIRFDFWSEWLSVLEICSGSDRAWELFLKSYGDGIRGRYRCIPFPNPVCSVSESSVLFIYNFFNIYVFRVWN